MAVATAYFDQMTTLTGNTAGAVQTLPDVTRVGGRRRTFVSSLTLASQASGTTIGVARLPIGAVINSIQGITDTSLGSTTISLGNSNSAAIYKAAATFTATETPTLWGLTATRGVPITSGYDCVTGVANRSYEDIVLVTGAATAPSSGTLRILIDYSID
jgi:hypothetical protein